MLITTAHQWPLASLAVSDRRIPEWLSIRCSLHNWGLVCWEATSGVNSLSQQLSAFAHSWCAGKQKSPAAWQESDSNCLNSKTSQKYAPFTFTADCMKTTPVHQRLETRHQLKPTRMFIRDQWGTSLSWSSMWLIRGQQPAELHWSSDWSVARLF